MRQKKRADLGGRSRETGVWEEEILIQQLKLQAESKAQERVVEYYCPSSCGAELVQTGTAASNIFHLITLLSSNPVLLSPHSPKQYANCNRRAFHSIDGWMLIAAEKWQWAEWRMAGHVCLLGIYLLILGATRQRRPKAAAAHQCFSLPF